MKSKLGLSWDKFKELTRLLRPHNVRLENENAERKYQSDILPQDLVVENHNFLFKNDKKEDYFHSAPAIFIDNFQNYLFHILDQYDNQRKLSWHGGNIPENEIWVKIGGDHGQGSLKITLQILNIEKPNSKFHTSIIAMAHVSDNVHNLQTLVKKLETPINALKIATWNGKKICIFFMWRLSQFLLTSKGYLDHLGHIHVFGVYKQRKRWIVQEIQKIHPAPE